MIQAIGRFEPTFIDAHEVSKMICNIRSLKSWLRTRSLIEEVIISSNEVSNDFESDMAVGIRKLGNPSYESAESDDTVKPTAGS